MTRVPKRIYDEVHGFIELTQLELELIDTPVLQRLRRIKQLSAAYIVYPGATHTRFSHSIGTMHLAGKVANRLNEMGYIDSAAVQLLRVAALLHDVGHTPFSHTIEMYYKKKGGGDSCHEFLTREVILRDPDIKTILRNHGLDPMEVVSILEGKHKNPIYNLLLNSDLDVDRMDYLLRDAIHTGVAYGLVDINRIINTLIVDEEGNLAVLDKGLQAVENFYVARLHMYQAVYYHKTITGFELLLERLFERLVEEVDEVRGLGEINNLLKLIEVGEFAYWDDSWLLGILNACARRKLECSEETSTLARFFLNRRVPKMVKDLSKLANVDEIPTEEEYLNDVVSRLRSSVPSDGIYVIKEPISVVHEDEAVLIHISRKNRSYPITDKERVNSLVAYLPQYYIVMRVYVDPRYPGALQ